MYMYFTEGDNSSRFEGKKVVCKHTFASKVLNYSYMQFYCQKVITNSFRI